MTDIASPCVISDKIFMDAKVFSAKVRQRADETGRSSTQTADRDCTRARAHGKVCALSFDTPDEVIGSVIKPDGEGIDATSAINFSSLIRMRWDFRAEIIRAAEDI